MPTHWTRTRVPGFLFESKQLTRELQRTLALKAGTLRYGPRPCINHRVSGDFRADHTQKLPPLPITPVTPITPPRPPHKLSPRSPKRPYRQRRMIPSDGFQEELHATLAHACGEKEGGMTAAAGSRSEREHELLCLRHKVEKGLQAVQRAENQHQRRREGAPAAPLRTHSSGARTCRERLRVGADGMIPTMVLLGNLRTAFVKVPPGATGNREQHGEHMVMRGTRPCLSPICPRPRRLCRPHHAGLPLSI